MQTDRTPAQAHTHNPVLSPGTHTCYLIAYAHSRLGDTELAKDLVQETFLAALEKPESFDGRCSERTWLVAILKNKITDVYRKKQTQVARLSELVYTQTADEPITPAEDFMPRLQKAILTLPPLWQMVFRMKHIEERPTKLICKKLNISKANYWVISHRTRVKLQAQVNLFN